ncbi:MAG: hypothetical protein JNM36_19600 [Chitinophagales bacterium]|nr:hypothetical protein [Chitinophagales bacterium]
MKTCIIFYFFALFSIAAKGQDSSFLQQVDSLIDLYQNQNIVCPQSEDTLGLIRKLIQTVLQQQGVFDSDTLYLPEGLNCRLINCAEKKEFNFYEFIFNYRKIDYRCLKTATFLNNSLCLSYTIDSLLSITYTTDSSCRKHIEHKFNNRHYWDRYENFRIKDSIVSVKFPYKNTPIKYFYYSKFIPTDIAIDFRHSTAMVIVDNNLDKQYHFLYNSKQEKWDILNISLKRAARRKDILKLKKN